MTRGGTFWLPKQASSMAADVDWVFYLIFYLGLLFFVGIVLVMLFFVIKYRKKDGRKTSPIKGNLKLEIFWAVVPSILLLIIFIFSFIVWMKLNVPPRYALDIRVTAQKWSWSFEYSKDGIVSPELVVPINQPVRLTMSSKDVIHSFFVPQFRVKKDVLPNRYSVIWFEATETGEFDIFCAEYCGTGHSQMFSKVVVLTEQKYQEWIQTGGGAAGEGLSSVEFGKSLFSKQGCVTCHSIDGSTLIGPSLLKKYGSEEKFTDSTTATIDDNYIRESITEPNTKIVQGFSPVMPTYKGRLNDKQINALIDYIKSLGEGT